ncbi:efflux RND transporter periplasmic adaptor subunit [Pedobacter arcticus]|uniref:efflux RND transporter periplasmic adaptor subunit n=1 Tax=Pedobacter arcticus TaxID=752140 RepID=UPI000311A261|nr:efflux RND transporter periplasmic adaptor subunit [Pedobacter arcticus]
MLNLYRNTLKAIFVLYLGLMMACTTHVEEKPKAEKFVVTDSLIKRLLVDTVEQANGKTELTFSAKITVNEERKSDLFPMVSGTVNNVNVRLGDEVKRGQTMATVISSEMAGFDKDVIAATAELKTAGRSLTQAKQLFKSGLTSERELQEAENDYQIKQAELKRANAVLNLNGGNQKGLYAIKSPLNGFVIEKNVTDFMQLRNDNDHSLFTVADLSEVWAMVNVYESEVSQIHVGDEVSLATLSYPAKKFIGKVDKIYNLINQKSRVMSARVVIKNPDFLLKPGMLGTAKVSASSGVDLPVLNARAVVFDNNKNYVLLLDEQQKVSIQEIEIGRKAGDKIYIKKGLKTGDRVIASKQVFLFESLKSK